MNVLYVFIGGGLGSVVRYFISNYFTRHFYSEFPFATLFSNTISCFILGCLTGYFLLSSKKNNEMHLLLATGFCGGFSTFSTFTNETYSLFRKGDLLLASANVLLSLVLCFAALISGIILVRAISKEA